MSRVKNDVHQSLTSIILFLRLFKTFEIGELIKICQLLEEEPSLYDDKIFARMLAQFIFHVNEENKKNHTEHEHLALLITESLIYNLFKVNNKNGVNSSIYSNSLMMSSASHINANDQSVHSMRHYESIEDHFTTNFVAFLQDFILDQELKKKLKQMVDRGSRKAIEGVNQNQRYIDILLETIQYILGKESKTEKNSELQYLKEAVGSKTTAISSHFEKKNLKVIIAQVNKIIFSKKLNRVVFMLEQADEKVYFSLLHIYLAQMTDEEEGRKAKAGKYFAGVTFSGEQMLVNLNWVYVSSIANKNELFDMPKNPLFKLIQSYLLCFFMPVFRSFSEVVGKCCKYDFANNVQFYKVCQTTINKNLSDFIEELPQDLLSYLRQLYKIIINCEVKSGKKQGLQSISTTALKSVKKLLVYSLLTRPTLIQSYFAQGVDLQKYETACNFIINLFFKSSLKRQHQGSNEELEFLQNITKSISNQLDEKIIGLGQEQPYFDEYDRSLLTKNYFIEEPMLNHDYEILWDTIKNIEFTPKDLKDFEMHKKNELNDKVQNVLSSPNQAQSFNNTNTNFFSGNLNTSIQQQNYFSPMHRAKKDSIEQNQSIDIFLNGAEDMPLPSKEEIDFLTWMSVGGTRDYQIEPRGRAASTNKLKELKKLPVFSRQKIREIQRLYQKYERIIS